MELTPEYIKAVRFTVKRGNTYDAAEVDAFLDELLVAVTARQTLRMPIPLQRCVPYAPR